MKQRPLRFRYIVMQMQEDNSLWKQMFSQEREYG